MNHPSGTTVQEAIEPAQVRSVWTAGTLTYTRIGLLVLFCLLLWGDFSWALKERSASPILQILIKDFHASDSEMQLFMVVIPNAMGILLGPVVSYRSDRFRSRWGRRIPFLLISTPFAVLAMMGLGFTPAMGRAMHHLLGPRSPGLNPTTRLFFGFFWVVFEVATVSANAVFAGLINDVVPRQFLGRFFGMFREISLFAAWAFNYWLIGLTETYFKSMFIGIGLVYGAGFMFMCLTVKEGQYPDPPEVDERRTGFLGACRIYMKECFSKPYYIWVMLAMMLGTLAFTPVNSFGQPFAKSLHISNDIYGKYMSYTYAISAIVTIFIGMLVDRFHPLRTCIASMSLYAVVTLWGAFYSANTRPLFSVPFTSHGVSHPIPVPTFAIALIGHGVISGIFFTCIASLGQTLFPRARFAQFYSATYMVIAVCSMILRD